MYRYIFSLITFIIPIKIFCQNVGIGTTSPTRAKLEVHGVAGAGRTAAIFGGDKGIALFRNIPGIGFNAYRDDSLSGNGRYLGNGYAAQFVYTHNDPSLSTGMELTFYPSGVADALIPAGIRPLNLTNNGRLSIMTSGNAYLDVGRSTGGDGTVMLQGTNYHSYFNYSTNENTYIRPGKSGNVYLNDITGGKIIFGDGGTRVGINTGSPVYTLEVRQIAGTGLRMAYSSYPSEHWEWRVAGSPSNFYLYHQGVVKNYLSATDGSMHPVSDGRLKTNVMNLNPVLTKMLKLRPVTYEMISDNPTHHRSLGFIAQEVQPLFPQLTFVSEKENDMMSLQYSGINVIAVKGVQEEQNHIDRIEINISDAEKRMEALEQKLKLTGLKISKR